MRGLRARLYALVVKKSVHDADTRRALVESLYASPTSLTIGAISGFALSIAVAIMADEILVTICAALICSDWV